MKIPSKLFTKNTILFTVGLAGVAHEALLTHTDRPTLLILFAAMMGLPAFLSSGQAVENQLRRDKVQLEEEISKIEKRLQNLKEKEAKINEDETKA